MQYNFKFKVDNDKEYKVNDICNSVVYAKKLAIEQLSWLYYLVL